MEAIGSALTEADGATCAASDTDCDGVDDDCDGRIDEDFQTRCMFGSFAVSCVNGRPVGENCNDYDPCTVDSCGASGCKHTPSCDDGNPCTVESCDPELGCRSEPVSGLACDDGDACTVGDSCDAAGSCQAGSAADADDQNPCTADSCDPASGVVHVPTPGELCDDGSVCTSDDRCNATGSCQPGSPLPIDDGDPCTADSCDPTSGVSHTVTPGVACSDGNACTLGDTCDEAGSCQPGAPAPLDDGNVCTADGCDPQLGVIHTPTPGFACDDGNVCTFADVCDAAGQCQPGAPPADTNCDGIDDDCDGVADDDYAGQPTACGVGACAATGISTCDAGLVRDNCMPGSPSSDANCDGVDDDCDAAADDDYVASCSDTAVVACVHGQLELEECDDDDVCTGEETCSAGVCQSGTPVATDDGNACTTDTCDPETGAVAHADLPVGTSCSDGLECNGLELCGHPCTPVPSGAMAHWPAEGNGYDTIGSHEGTLNGGVVFSSGVAGQAFGFDGSNDYVRATVPLADRNAATLEAWVRTSMTSGDGYIVSVPYRSAGGNNGFDMLVRSGRVMTCAYPTGSGKCGTYAVPVSDGQWHHVVTTFANDTVSFYFDGELKGSMSVSGVLRTDHDEVNIGRFGGYGKYFRGDIDEIRIYERGLTATEVASRFEARGSLCLLTCLAGTPSPDVDACEEPEQGYAE